MPPSVGPAPDRGPAPVKAHRRRADKGCVPSRPAASLLATAAYGLFAGLLAASPASGEAFFWVDENGVTHLTDDDERAPASARGADIDELRQLWSNGVQGPSPVTPPGSSSSEEDRVIRLLRGAAQDFERGETARAAAALRSVLRLDPGRPEAHWYLALLDRQRGRYEAAEQHLRSFLSNAGDDLQAWRASAQRRLETLEDERGLEEDRPDRAELDLLVRRIPNFRIQLDAELERNNPGYAETVGRYLEGARAEVSQQLGVTPLEPLGVVFYGKAAYRRAHRHRFSFQTVGFFDGRIHVSSPGYPSGALRSLLFHEYTHAVYREQTGDDRPYWLNEGLAELVERRSRRQPDSTRSERVSLRRRIAAGTWLPLQRLSPSFSGLDNDDARAAYLESIVAAAWLERHTDREGRARLLERLGAGFSADQALHEVIGLDMAELDAAIQADLRSEFTDWEAMQPASRASAPGSR